MIHCYTSKGSLIIFDYNQYIPHVGNVCVVTGMNFQKIPLSGIRESYKNAHCALSEVLIVTEETQQILRWF
jgi:hypothetical protein